MSLLHQSISVQTFAIPLQDLALPSALTIPTTPKSRKDFCATLFQGTIAPYLNLVSPAKNYEVQGASITEKVLQIDIAHVHSGETRSKRQKESVNERIDGLQGEIRDLQGEIRDLQGEICDLQGEIRGHKDEIHELNSAEEERQRRGKIEKGYEITHALCDEYQVLYANQFPQLTSAEWKMLRAKGYNYISKIAFVTGEKQVVKLGSRLKNEESYLVRRIGSHLRATLSIDIMEDMAECFALYSAFSRQRNPYHHPTITAEDAMAWITRRFKSAGQKPRGERLRLLIPTIQNNDKTGLRFEPVGEEWGDDVDDLDGDLVEIPEKRLEGSELLQDDPEERPTKRVKTGT